MVDWMNAPRAEWSLIAPVTVEWMLSVSGDQRLKLFLWLTVPSATTPPDVIRPFVRLASAFTEEEELKCNQ
jgi:hypothetical protein